MKGVGPDNEISGVARNWCTGFRHDTETEVVGYCLCDKVQIIVQCGC